MACLFAKFKAGVEVKTDKSDQKQPQMNLKLYAILCTGWNLQRKLFLNIFSINLGKKRGTGVMYHLLV